MIINAPPPSSPHSLTPAPLVPPPPLPPLIPSPQHPRPPSPPASPHSFTPAPSVPPPPPPPPSCLLSFPHPSTLGPPPPPQPPLILSPWNPQKDSGVHFFHGLQQRALEGIRLGEPAGASAGHGDVDVQQLRGHVAEGKIADYVLVAHRYLRLAYHSTAGPRHLEVCVCVCVCVCVSVCVSVSVSVSVCETERSSDSASDHVTHVVVVQHDSLRLPGGSRLEGGSREGESEQFPNKVLWGVMVTSTAWWWVWLMVVGVAHGGGCGLRYR